jgi:hypothetical protein
VNGAVTGVSRMSIPSWCKQKYSLSEASRQRKIKVSKKVMPLYFCPVTKLF